MKILLATIKKWNISNANNLIKITDAKHTIKLITKKEDLNLQFIEEFSPDYIFFPHWSWIIPEKIFTQYNCIVFHMTDLPFGRGGSPLQNLIDRGIKNTKISALKVTGDIDSGDIYMKRDLNLHGNAEEIFMRASKIIFNDMIPQFLSKNISTPLPQDNNNAVIFSRRTPSQSEIKQDFDLEKIYDYIRMLDAEGYPRAFIKFGKYKLFLSRARLGYNNVIADVEISCEGESENEN